MGNRTYYTLQFIAWSGTGTASKKAQTTLKAQSQQKPYYTVPLLQMLLLFSGAGGTSTRAEQYGHRPDFWISQVSTHSFCEKNVKINESLKIFVGIVAYMVNMPAAQQPQRLRGVAAPSIRELDRPSIRVPRRLNAHLLDVQSGGRERERPQLEHAPFKFWHASEGGLGLGLNGELALADPPRRLELGEADHARRPVLREAHERVRAALPASVPRVALFVGGAQHFCAVLDVCDVRLGVATPKRWPKGDEASPFRRRWWWRWKRRRGYRVCHGSWKG